MSAHVQFSGCRHAKTIPTLGSRRSKTCTNPDLTILPVRRSMPPPTELRRADHASRHLALGDCVD
jgi:hypothetical protein